MTATHRIIAAFSRTFALEPFPGAPDDIAYIAGQSTHSLTGPQLVEVHNLAASNLGVPRVKRFSDTATAQKRTWAILQKLDDTPVEDLAHSPAPLARVQGALATKSSVQLTPGDKAQIKDGADARKPKQSDALLEAAAAAGARAQAQAALRLNPPTSDNAAKDAEMPALRKAVKVTELAAKKKVYPRKEGSKQAVLVDLLSRPEGATFGELYDGLAATGKPWKGVTIRSGLAWDINHIAGYGVSSELLNGEEMGQQGRTYEAHRLGWNIDTGLPEDGYDPDLKLAVYHLAYPAGMDAPLPHTPKKA